MSDVNLPVLNSDVSKPFNNTMSFNKKNAWKNEWEKAQLETKSNDKPYSKADNQSLKDNALAADGRDLNKNINLISEVKPVTGRQASVAEINIKNEIDYNVANSGVFAKVTTFSFSGSLSSNLMQNMPNNMKADVLKSFTQENYSLAVIDKSEAKFSSKYKLQNLNILFTESGSKIVLRDYRLDKDQLTKIVDEITAYLDGFGVEVNDVIINGITYEK